MEFKRIGSRGVVQIDFLMSVITLSCLCGLKYFAWECIGIPEENAEIFSVLVFASAVFAFIFFRGSEYEYIASNSINFSSVTFIAFAISILKDNFSPKGLFMVSAICFSLLYLIFFRIQKNVSVWKQRGYIFGGEKRLIFFMFPAGYLFAASCVILSGNISQLWILILFYWIKWLIAKRCDKEYGINFTYGARRECV